MGALGFPRPPSFIFRFQILNIRDVILLVRCQDLSVWVWLKIFMAFPWTSRLISGLRRLDS